MKSYKWQKKKNKMCCNMTNLSITAISAKRNAADL